MATTQTVSASKSGKKLAPSVAAGKFRPPVKAPVKPEAPKPPAPVAEAAAEPVKRGRGRPRKNPELTEQLQASVEATSPAPRPVAAPTNGAREKELAGQIDGLKGQIAKLQELVAKSKQGPQARHRDEIAAEFKFAKGDWRAEYHGYVVPKMKPFRYVAKNDTIEILESSPISNCLLAMPRDNDPGGAGARARNAGQIAVYWELSEDGESYFGSPAYVSQEELAEIWIEE